LAESFAYTLETIQHLNRREDMGRVGPLAPTGFKQAKGPKLGEHQVEEQELSLAAHEAGAKLAQH
jgi:hypothetical protein